LVNSVSFISENKLNNRRKEPLTKELPWVDNKYSGNLVTTYVIIYFLTPELAPDVAIYDETVDMAGVSKLQLVYKSLFIF